MFEGVEPMGRGRAKAKQVKVARQLKYNSGGTDLDRLRTELGVGRDDEGGTAATPTQTSAGVTPMTPTMPMTTMKTTTMTSAVTGHT